MAWAVCPECGAVVGDAQSHTDWHALMVADAEVLSGTSAPTVTEGDHWPEGLPVPSLVIGGAENLSLIRERVADFRAAVATGIGACDTYLAIGSPTQAQAVGQVRILTQITRGLLVAVRAIVNLTLRSNEE